MKVSVFMFCRNGAATIRRAIDSVLAQDWPDLEFVVQDGASTDGTLEILKEYGELINWISEADSGPDEGFYRAIERCSGEFIGSCLVDEEMLPGSIETAVSMMISNPGVVAVTRDAILTDVSGRKIGEFVGRPFRFHEYLEARYVPHFSTSFFRRSSILKSNILKKPWRLGCGEFEFWVRLLLEGEVRYLAGFASKYAIHDDQLSRRTDNVLKLVEGRVGVLQEVFTEEESLGAECGTTLKRSIAGNVRQFGSDLLALGDRKRFEKLMERARLWLGIEEDMPIDDAWILQLQTAHCAALESSHQYEFLESVAGLCAQAYLDETVFALFRFRALFKMGRLETANRLLESLLESGRLRIAELSASFHELAQHLESRGDVDRAIKCWERAWPGSSASAQSQALVARIKSPNSDHMSLLQSHCKWGREFVLRKPYGQLLTKNRLADEGRIRIGVSCSFWSAPTIKYQFLSSLAQFDPARFEFVAYVNYDDGFRGAPGVSIVRVMHGRTEEEFAEQARADDLDILVELNGHSPGHRFAAMGLRCAPIQVSYLNYTATSGVYEMDYLIGDEIACGPEEDAYSCESIIRLPRCFFCFNYGEEHTRRSVALPSRKNGYITFGCFASAGKINPEQIRVFARLLESVPSAKLVVRNQELSSESNRVALLSSFAAFGVREERLEVLPGLGRSDLLREYERIDITLDTFPYNGGNCVAESLWHGVPVVTRYGKRFSSRYGASLLTSSGCSEFIARSEEEYIQLCVALAEDETSRETLRSELPRMMKSNGFSDTKDFAKHLGDAFEEMVWRYQRSREFCMRLAGFGLEDEMTYGNVFLPWIQVGGDSHVGLRYIQQIAHWVNNYLLRRSGMRVPKKQMRLYSALGRNFWYSFGEGDRLNNDEAFFSELSKVEAAGIKETFVFMNPYDLLATELSKLGELPVSEFEIEEWSGRCLSPLASVLGREKIPGSEVFSIDERSLLLAPESTCSAFLEFVLGRPLIVEEREALAFALDRSSFDEKSESDGFKVALQHGQSKDPEGGGWNHSGSSMHLTQEKWDWLDDKLRAFGLESLIRDREVRDITRD